MNKKLEVSKEEIVKNYTKTGYHSATTEKEEAIMGLAQVHLDHVIQKLADQNLISLENSRKLKAGSAYLDATEYYFKSLARGGESARKNLDNESTKVHKSEEKAIKTYLKAKKQADKRFDQRTKHIAKEFKYKKSYGSTVEHYLVSASNKYKEILEQVASFLGSYRSRDRLSNEIDEVVFDYLKNKIEVKSGKVNF